MKKCMHKIENMPLQPSSIYSCPYRDRKLRTCQKLGNGPGVCKCPAPGQCKICKCPTPGTDITSHLGQNCDLGEGRWSVTQISLSQTVHSPLYFPTIVEIGRSSWMDVKSTWGAVDGLGRSEEIIFLFYRLPPAYIWNQDGRPYRWELDPDDLTRK